MKDLIFFELGMPETPYCMALEEAVGMVADPDGPAFFIMGQSALAVVVGRHQNAHSAANLEEMARRGIPLVRRMTGGGTIYQNVGIINFRFHMPRGRPMPDPATRLLEPLAEYLTALGVNVIVEGRNDMSIPGAGKFVGLAGCRWPSGRSMVHCSLLFDASLGQLSELLLVDPVKYQSRNINSMRSRITNLKEYLPFGLAGFWVGMKRAYGFEHGEPMPENIHREALRLAREKYSGDAWNLGEKPPADIYLRNRFMFGSLELHLAVKKKRIGAARVTGDFLLPYACDPIQVEHLESLLIGLPADKPAAWAEAWERVDLDRVFYSPNGDVGEVTRWLASESV